MLRGIQEAASSLSTMSGQYYHPAVSGPSPPTTTRPSTTAPSGPKATRNRQPVSCAACRRSKLKCDRQKPCEACVRRGYRDQCFYEAAKVLPRKRRRMMVASHNAKERLDNLEALVLQMASPSGDPANASVGALGAASSTNPGQALADPQASSEGGSGSGHVAAQGSPIMYVGSSTHLSAILENIQELKTVIVSEEAASDDGHVAPLEEQRQQQQQQHGDIFDPDTLVLFSTPRPASFEKILDALPPRSHVDRYLSIYFKASYLVLPILHQAHFQRQYDDFWRDPPRAPPMWTSILFSILTIASTVGLMNQSINLEEEQARREEFLTAAAQCLTIGNYGKPQEYILEALILFVQTKYVASLDPSREVALVLAIAFRHAFEMGYHRDPDHFSHLTVFEGEMRRRMWSLCLQIDLLQGYQLGLPTYIQHDSYDTRPFSNLADTDFDAPSSHLPPSRPETEPTRILQFGVKCRLITSFARAFRIASSITPYPLSTILELDREVRAAHNTVPASLQIRRIASSFADSSSVIMARIDIELLFRKTLCMLHRKAMIAGHAYSRDACRTSALAILTHLVDLRRELQPGTGMLADDQWLMSCYTMHDFLLAAMLLCLVAAQRRKKKMTAGRAALADRVDHTSNNGAGDDAATARRDAQEEIDMIREAYRATCSLSEHSREARRVSGVLASMLKSLEGSSSCTEEEGRNGVAVNSNPIPQQQQQQQQQYQQNGGQYTNTTAINTSNDQDAAAAVAFPAARISAPTLEMPRSHQHSYPHQHEQHHQHQQAQLLQFTFEQDPFDNMGDIPEDIDWACLDQYYLNAAASLNSTGLGGGGAGVVDANMFLYHAPDAAVAAAAAGDSAV